MTKQETITRDIDRSEKAGDAAGFVLIGFLAVLITLTTLNACGEVIATYVHDKVEIFDGGGIEDGHKNRNRNVANVK